MKYYSFIERMVTKLADVLSSSARYEKMFEHEQRVRTALTDLYLEVLLFLQRIRATISTGCRSSTFHCREAFAPALTSFLAFKVLAKSVFRSVDVEFQDDVQRLSRMTKVFKEEIKLAHRQHIEDHLKEQRFTDSTIDRRAVQSEQKLIRHSERGVQEGSYALLPCSCWILPIQE